MAHTHAHTYKQMLDILDKSDSALTAARLQKLKISLFGVEHFDP